MKPFTVLTQTRIPASRASPTVSAKTTRTMTSTSATTIVAPVSPYDLYVEMPDPVTQEMRVFRVPGLQADPDTLRFLTQDFHWPQTQVLPAEALNGNDLHDRGLLGQQEAAPDPWRTEPTGEAPAGTGHAGATPALDTTRLDSQDLDWSQTQAEGVAMDMMEAPKHSGNSMELGSSSQDGAVAALQQVGSSGSSEGRPVPSVPSFDDDLALPPAPQWPLPREEQLKMEEIVASLSCMSVNLVANGKQACLPRPTAPPPSSQSRSPTYNAARRQRRRGRPRALRGAGPNDAKSTGIATVQQAGQALQGCVGGAKRKRSGLGAPTRSGSFGPDSQQRASPANQKVFSCSPSSPPRRKVRKTFGPPTSASSTAGRAEMIATYTRLRDLRFRMHDIIGGKEALPTAQEVESLRQEVLVIIGNMEQSEPIRIFFFNPLKQAHIRKQEARQVADKLLHQLRVIAEVQSQSNDDTDCTTSCHNTNVELPFQSLSIDPTLESKVSPQEKKTGVHPITSQNLKNENIPKKSVKEKKQKCEKQKTDSKKAGDYLKQSEENSVGTSNDVEVNHDSAKNVWRSCITPLYDKRTDTEGQLGVVIVEETEENLHEETVTDRCTEIPQTEIFSEAVLSNTVSSEENKISASFPSMTDNRKDSTSSKPVCEPQTEEIDPAKQEEYQYIVGLIKSKAATSLTMKTLENDDTAQEIDFTCSSGPMMLTGILLPKQSELEPILNLPENFWGNPQAPIPEEWINMLEWED
ncbi:uncharacterized protein LOC117649587 [Thrips palmi]|uniref:Uncharacterized protein LOC117649587 n=1 Tax=Thrips palmi TaxID=161013 RepID=A0A6P8ZSY9_THRPL|nr:uncharacterized protein LOC117649587 [Thrips palmi]